MDKLVAQLFSETGVEIHSIGFEEEEKFSFESDRLEDCEECGVDDYVISGQVCGDVFLDTLRCEHCNKPASKESRRAFRRCNHEWSGCRYNNNNQATSSCANCNVVVIEQLKSQKRKVVRAKRNNKKM